MFQKTVLRLALRLAANQNGNPPEVGQLLADSAAFNEYATKHFAKAYGADPDGKMFLAATNPTALPPGWFMNILNWVMANFPAILADIISIINLFPHAMKAQVGFSWTDALGVLKEVLPSFAAIAADALAGMPVSQLIVKYSQSEVELFQHIIGEITA
jgi:hypothetical protein